jgi:hypothetical protein
VASIILLIRSIDHEPNICCPTSKRKKEKRQFFVVGVVEVYAAERWSLRSRHCTVCGDYPA